MKNNFDIIDFAAQVSKFIETHFKKVLALFVAAIMAGGVWAWMKSVERENQQEAFNELYKITKVYNEKKTEFQEAKEAKEKKAEDKTADADKEKEKKNLTAATGDLDKDYPEVVKNLEAFLDKHSNKNAAGEAALILSEIYDNYDMPEKGAEVVNKALKHWDQKNVIYFVMQMRSGDLRASAGQCDQAVSFWKVVAGSESFIADQAKLKLGVCLQEIGKIEEAKQWFKKIEAEDPNSSEGFSAKRYLRFLEFKTKTGEGAGTGKAQQKTSQKDKAS